MPMLKTFVVSCDIFQLNDHVPRFETLLHVQLNGYL